VTPAGGPGAVSAAGHDGGAAIAPPVNPAAPGGGARGGGARNVPQAQTFTVRPGGYLNPTSVSSSAAGPIELRVVSNDGRSRRIMVRTTNPQTLTVPAHGRASMLLTGLARGRYVLDVDGLARGELLIGG
jgi:hypothetical protein